MPLCPHPYGRRSSSASACSKILLKGYAVDIYFFNNCLSKEKKNECSVEKSKTQFVQVMPSAVRVDVSVPVIASCVVEGAAGSSDNPLSSHRAGGSLAGATDRFLCVKYSSF